jgi:NAD(P)-dependent dehydrogenase (short-subunit alcohol dehydrogenase family)
MTVLVVTGGSRGIGAAVCRLAGARGYDVVVNYASDASAAERVVSEITAAGGQAVAVAADVSKEDDVTRLFEVADGRGRLSGVVSNAGITGDRLARLDEIDVDTVRRVLDVNVTGVFLCSRAAVRRMSTRYGGHGGVIVNVSSTAAHRGSPGEWVHYAASKAAVETMVLNLAPELGRRGITINAIAPGATTTDMSAEVGRRYAHPDLPLDPAVAMRVKTALGRRAEPAEIAAAIAFLVSDDAAYLTGRTLAADGGYF